MICSITIFTIKSLTQKNKKQTNKQTNKDCRIRYKLCYLWEASSEFQRQKDLRNLITLIRNMGIKILIFICLCVLVMSRTPFYSESALCSCLNVMEVLARKRRDIWSLCDCNEIQTHTHLVRKQTLKHLGKWLRVCLQTKWLWVPFAFD